VTDRNTRRLREFRKTLKDYERRKGEAVPAKKSYFNPAILDLKRRIDELEKLGREG